MATEPSGPGGERITPDPMDALADLEAVRTRAQVEAWLPPLSIWYTPVLALLLVTIALGLRSSGAMALIALGVAAALATALVIHTGRTQSVKPRPGWKPARFLLPYGAAMVITVGVLKATETLIDSAGGRAGDGSSLVGVLLLAWVGSSLVLAVGIVLANRLHDRWMQG